MKIKQKKVMYLGLLGFLTSLIVLLNIERNGSTLHIIFLILLGLSWGLGAAGHMGMRGNEYYGIKE